MEKHLKSTKEIRFADCNPFNHLNSFKYLEYLIESFEDHFKVFYKLDLFKHIQDTGKGWLLVSNQIRCVTPAQANEKVWVESKVIQLSSNEMLIEVQMWDKKLTHIKAFGWLRYEYRDMITLQNVQQPNEIVDLLKTALVSIDHNVFEDRVDYILNLIK